MRAQYVISLMVLAACYHQPRTGVSSGAYRFRVEMWRDTTVRGARFSTDSVGVFEGVLNLNDDPKASTVDLENPDDGPGCANRGVQLRADMSLAYRGNVLLFSCPGLGPEKRAVAALYFNLDDLTGRSLWSLSFRQEDCAPEPGFNTLDPRCIHPLGGRLVLLRSP